MCEKLEDGLWVFGRDEEGPYTKRANQWIGYDDPISVKIKTAYVRAMGLGGVSLYSLDLDDFQVIVTKLSQYKHLEKKTKDFFYILFVFLFFFFLEKFYSFYFHFVVE